MRSVWAGKYAGEDRGGKEGKEWKSEVEARLADMFGVVTGLTINDVPKKNKKGKRVA